MLEFYFSFVLNQRVISPNRPQREGHVVATYCRPASSDDATSTWFRTLICIEIYDELLLIIPVHLHGLSCEEVFPAASNSNGCWSCRRSSPSFLPIPPSTRSGAPTFTAATTSPCCRCLDAAAQPLRSYSLHGGCASHVCAPPPALRRRLPARVLSLARTRHTPLSPHAHRPGAAPRPLAPDAPAPRSRRGPLQRRRRCSRRRRRLGGPCGGRGGRWRGWVMGAGAGHRRVRRTGAGALDLRPAHEPHRHHGHRPDLLHPARRARLAFICHLMFLLLMSWNSAAISVYLVFTIQPFLRK